MTRRYLLVSGVLLAMTHVVLAQQRLPHLEVDLRKSIVEWTGKKITGEHYGELKLSNGHLSFSNNRLTGGSFEVDMNSLVCIDITDPKSNKRLVDHLKSEDFFAVNRFPIAKFDLTNVSQKTDVLYEVTGKVTIKGKSDIISFPVQFKSKDGIEWVEAAFVIDRSKFDVRFGSQSFFENLGDTMVYDDIDISVKLALPASTQ